MANDPISSLPIAIALDGSEYTDLVQGGTTKRAQVSLINSVNPANIPIGGLTGQGLVKQSNANYDTAWKTVSGFGTVQEVDTGTGLTGGPITLTGTVSLAPIASHTLLANITGGSAAPIPNTPSSVLDIIGATQGDILYRDSGAWAALAPGSNGQILTSQGAAANPKWSAVGSGTVQSVGLALPAIFTVSGSPVTTTGTLTGALANQNPNIVFAGPATGSAAAPTFRSLVGADLPNPSASSLGGIQSTVGVSHQWISSISTSGVPGLSQPAFTDISGTASASQLPNPTLSTLGGIEAINAVASNWIRSITTSGVPQLSQPAFSDLTGSATLAQLPSIGNNTILSNISGGSSTPLANSLSSIIDSTIASTQGDILYRNGSAWVALPPGTSGQVLSTGGAAANPSWTTVTGTGTVTSIATNNGLTGGTITSSGTIGLATIATGNVLAYTGAGSGVPVATAPSGVLDVIGSTEGDILYRGASTWSALPPGTSGQFLQTAGAGSTPSWASVGVTVGATSVTSGTSHGVLVNSAGTLGNTAAGSLGQALVSNGSGADPTFKSGAWTLLNTLTASNSPTLSDTTSITSAYTEYEIVLENILPATNNVTIQLQQQVGGAFQTSSYLSTNLFGNTATANSQSISTGIVVSNTLSVVNAGFGVSGRYLLSAPLTPIICRYVYGTFVSWNGSNLITGTSAGGFDNGSAATTTGIQVLATSGNLTSGVMKIYGRVN